MTNRPTRNGDTCDVVQQCISARHDGELQSLDQREVEKHVATCSECEDFQRSLGILHVRLVNEFTELTDSNQDSDQLWSQIRSRLNAEDAHVNDATVSAQSVFDENDSDNTGVRRRHWLIGVAIAASLLLALTLSVGRFYPTNTANLPMVAESVRDFETFQLRGGPLDVDSQQVADIEQWMSAKVDFELPDTLQAPEGFQVSGGRLCSFLNRRLAFFHYENGSDAVSLYVMKSKGLRIPNNGNPDSVTTTSGLATVTWAEGDLAYVAISELSADRLSALMPQS